MRPPLLGTPPAIGPYEILDALGQGGMGIVYRARHQRTGDVVALKTVRVAEPELLSCIQREIDALAAVRHPGVVRILDEGTEDGVPWCAMELLRGETLRELMTASAPDGRTEVLWLRTAGDEATRRLHDVGGAAPGTGAALPRSGAVWSAGAPALGAVRQLCHALAYLHGEGIVHRDLKPENVLIRPDGQAVLIDFGLTQALPADGSREALQLPGEVLGTAAYMSPEQIRGEILDARSDLYALGCMLHEAIAGSPPHPGPGPKQILLGHLATPAPRLSELVDGVPPELDELLARLLTKERRLRTGRASAVGDLLGRLGVPGIVRDGPAPRPYLYRPGLVGRETERARVRAQIESGPRRGSGVVLVRGASGAGKTRLALEVASDLRDAGHGVLTGACMPDAPPLSPLRALLQALARHVAARGMDDERLPRGGLRLLARHEPALRENAAIAELTEPTVEPAERRRLLLSALVRSCEILAAERPMLLLLDDLQWADDLTLEFLQVLAGREAAEGATVNVLATTRPDEGAALRALGGAGQACPVIDIDALDRRAVGEMVTEMLACPVEASLLDGIARQSGGSPFYVAELLAAGLASGELAYDERGALRVQDGRGFLASAPSLPGIMARRLASLSEGARLAAELASVLDREVTTRLLGRFMARAAGTDDRGFRAAVRALLWRRVLEEPFPGRLCFTHDGLREATYVAIAPERLPDLHRHAALAIESLPPYRRSEILGSLGRHWERAADLDRARDAYLEAARAAAGKQAFVESAALYAAHLGLAAPSAGSLAVRRELALDVLRPAGRMAEAMSEMERVVAEARGMGEDAEERGGVESLGELAWLTGDAARAEELLNAARDRHRAAGDRRGEGRALRLLGRIAYTQDRFDAAEGLCTEALRIHRDMDDRQEVGRALAEIAGARHAGGRETEASDLYRQALAVFRDVGDVRGEAMSLGNLASLHWEGERYAEAEACGDAALAAARRCGDRSLEGFLLGGQGALAFSRGDFEGAASHFLQSLSVAREVLDRRQEARVLANLAETYRELGRPGESRRYLEACVAIRRLLGDREGAAEAEDLLRRLPV